MIRALLARYERPGRTLLLNGILLVAIVWGGILLQWHFQRVAGAKAFKHHASEMAVMLQSQIDSTLAGGAAYSLGISNLRLKAVVQGLLPIDDEGLLRSLEQVQKQIGADIIFAMNSAGDVVISTRHDGGQTLTGNNYAFRPYFTMALEGHSVVYPALGATTFQRGLYYTAPIYADTGNISGVIVFKMPFATIDKQFRNANDILSLVSPQGVVFTSSIPSWKLKTIVSLRNVPLSERILKTHPEYGSEYFRLHSSDLPLTLRRGRIRWEGRKYAVQTCPVRMNDPQGDWTLLVMRDPAIWFPAGQTLLNALVLLSLYLAITAMMRARRRQQLTRISSLKKTAEAAETYRSIFNSTNDALFVHDADTGKVLEANSSARKLYGYHETDLSLLTLDGDFPYPPSAANAAFNAAMQNRTQIITFEAQSRSGRQFWAEATFRIYSIHGTDRILANVHDITAQRTAHNALTATKEQLEREVEIRTAQLLQAQKMAAIGKFAERITHDVTNAMTRIIGYADIIRHNLIPDETLNTSLHEICSAAHDMCDMSSEVLAFARPAPLKLTAMNLCRVVEGFETFIRTSAPSKINVIFQIPRERLPVNLSPNHIEQALAHLALNSFESMQDGGTLTISVRRNAPDEFPPSIDAEQMTPADMAVIEIMDTGKGFTAEHLPHVFDPFFTTKTDSKRRGMGLTSVYIIISSHHGWVNAMDSAKAGGGGVQIWLPLKVKDAALGL